MVSLRFNVKMNRFPELPGRVKHAAGPATLKSAERIAADARSRYSATPGDTGEMRNKTQARASGALSAIAESTAKHAIYQDMGTRYIGATRFFSGAAEAEAGRFEGEIASAVRGALG